MSISNLNPVSLWSNFENLNKVPRPSKKEERIIQFMVDFGNQLSLETSIDKIKNVSKWYSSIQIKIEEVN